jgi:CHAT domain-containing protein/Flp pilus assembly protein TadD
MPKKRQKPARAEHLFDKGFKAYQRGDFEVARKAFAASLSESENLIRKGRAELRPSLARTRMGYAACLDSLGEFEAARTVYQHILDEVQALIAEGRAELRPELASTRMNYANCLSELGEFEAARTAYQHNLGEYQALIVDGRAELRPKLAKTRVNYASCLYSLGEFETARTAYQHSLDEYQALIARGRAELRAELALTGMNYANCLDNLGELEAARTAYQHTLDEIQALTADGRAELQPSLARTRMNYAICLKNLGELEAARTAYQHTLDEYQALIADGRVELRPELAGARMNYANCLSNLGELEAACTTYQHSLDEYQALIADGRAELRPYLAGIRMGYALCLRQLGELEAARTAYQHSLDEYQALIADGRAEELRPDLAKTRMNYAVCLRQLGELEAARTAYQHTLDEYQALIADGRAELRPSLASTRVNYASCLANLGELEAARTAYQHALDEYQALIADGRAELRPDLTLTRYNLALCLEDLGDYTATENQYQTSYADLQTLQQVGQLPLDAINMMRVIADWYQNPKRPNGADQLGAFGLAKQGLDWLETLLNRVSDAGKTFLLEQNLELFHLAADLALALNQPAAAYVILERSKSCVLVEQMLTQRATPGPTVEAALRQQYQLLRELLRELVQSLGTGRDNSNTDGSRFLAPVIRTTKMKPEQEQQLLKTQFELEQRLQLVRTAIAKQDAAFGEAIQPKPLTEAAITALLPESVLAIAFEQRPGFLYLYAITADGIPAPRRVNLTAKQLRQRVETFKSNIISEIQAKEALDIQDWLTEQLGPAIQSFVDGTTLKDILFIAHQAWHLLPLHLIQLDGQPLSHHYAVRYIPSLQVLRLLHQRHQAAVGQGCIIANPDGTLPSAEQEAQTIKTQHRPKDTLLIGQQAKLAPVREHLRQAEHGHFSCHGAYEPNLKASLKLADGTLEAKELFASLRLPNPRLVILSACESAQIQATLADEYMGLPSSFLFAGAHNVLAALWRVEDDSTRLLMEEFYQGLADGLTPTLALQHAQQQLREMPRDTVQARLGAKKTTEPMPKNPYQNPYYWAGFVLIGDGL